MQRRSSVVMLSGGIDSCVCLHIANNPIACIGIDYGQPHKIELNYAEKIADKFGLPFEVISIPLITKSNDVVFNCRNATIACLGASYASSIGATTVYMGSNWSDWNRFPDCRPDFYNHLRKSFASAEYPVSISTPLIHMTKTEVVNLAKKHKIDLSKTYSCYEGKEQPCNSCLACKTRKEAGA